MSENTTPERVTLIVTRDGRVSSVLGHGTIGNPRMDADAIAYVRADILRELREAVEEILERWDDSEVSEAPEAIYRRLRRALASLEEKEDK